MARTLGRSALVATSRAVYALWNVTEVTSLAPGGVHDRVPPPTRLPYVRYELMETGWSSEINTFAQNGRTILVRAHIFTQAGTTETAWSIVDQLVALMNQPGNYAPLDFPDGGYEPTAFSEAFALLGYQCVHVWYEQSEPGADELVAGDPVEHLVTEFRVLVEEEATAA